MSGKLPLKEREGSNFCFGGLQSLNFTIATGVGVGVGSSVSTARIIHAALRISVPEEVPRAVSLKRTLFISVPLAILPLSQPTIA